MRELELFPGGIPRQEDLRFFHDLSRTIAHRYDLQLQMKMLFDRFGGGLGRLSLVGLDDRRNAPYFLYTHGFEGEAKADLLEQRFALRWAQEQGRIFLASQHEEQVPGYAAVIPLQIHGTLLGLLVLHDQVPEDWGNIACLAQGLLMILEIRRMQDAQEYHATHDDKTGLHNLAFFQEALAAEIAKVSRHPEVPLSLVVLDIERFSFINDQLGYKIGDEVLRRVGEVIKEATRASDHKCRLKEDEFGIILPASTTLHAVGVVERIQEILARRTFRYKDRNIKVLLRGGIVGYEPGVSRKDLIVYAEKAVMRAKELDRRHYVIRISDEE